MSRFKWYRKLRGGIWARIDCSGYGGYTADDWVQMTELDLRREDYSISRIREVENYTNEVK